MGLTIGIDLGTTNSCLAVIEGREPVVLENSEGGRTTPSVVALGNSRLVGDIAKRQAAMHPEETIFSIKRFIGRTVDEVDSQPVPYQVAAGDNQAVEIEVEGRRYAPPEIAAMILSKIKEDAERKLGQEVSAAVITVPAYFNDSQRQATKDAGRIAGLEVVRIINEPTAAALAYGLGQDDIEQTVLVVDLGGGTLDVSVLEIGEGVFEVLATAGDNHLGGDDFDQAISDWLKNQVEAETGIDLYQDPGARQRLLEAAEKAKIELSSKPEAAISIPFISANNGAPIHVDQTVSQAQFRALVENLLQRLEDPISAALQQAEAIDTVLLVGGMTRVPAVQERIEELTGQTPHRGVNPDEVVALGAAIQAGILIGDIEDLLLLDVTPLTLGLETKGGVMTKMFERNTRVPSWHSEIFSTAEDNQSSVEIHVVQGEREMAQFNKSLGRFVLGNIPPAPSGVPEIEVRFEIDANGILQVAARELTTGTEQSIEITGSSGLSEEEIERMVSEAQQQSEADRRQREQVELDNEAQRHLNEYRRRIEDLNDQILDSEKDLIEARAFALRDARQGGETRELRGRIDDLLAAFHAVAERIYNRGESPKESTENDL